MTRRLARALAALLVGAAALLALTAPAGAHASLVSTSPTDGAALDAAPTEVVLTFTETITMGVGGIRVLDQDGDRVDRGSPEVEGDTARIEVADLDDGAYVVAWRAVSADSHPIDGSTTFTVGTGVRALDDSVVANLIGTDDGPWRVAATVARGLGLAGLLLAVGLGTFMAFAHDGGPEARRLRRTQRIAAAGGALGLIIEIPFRAALATGRGPGSVVDDGVLGQVLGDRVGITLGLTGLALLFAVVDGGRDRLSSAAAAVGVGVALALSGHTAATSPWLVAVLGDAAHVVAASVWFGGIVGCLIVATARRRQPGAWASVIVRFSPLAAAALVLLGIGGGALGWTEVRTVDALFSTTYGQLLIAKLVLVGVAATLGGVNRYRVVPILDAALADATTPEPIADGDAATPIDEHVAPPIPSVVTRVLRRTLAAEAVVLLCVVGATAVLVDVTPARAAAAAPFSEVRPLGDGTADLTVDPTRVGQTEGHLFLYGADGRPLEPEAVTVRMSLPAAEIAPIEREPLVAGPGHWVLDGSEMTIAGTWRIEVVARTSQFDQTTAAFEVRLVA